MRIIGIDPGSIICGYGIIDLDGSQMKVVNYGVIKAKKLEPEINHRIKEIYQRIYSIIDRDKPSVSVFESTFFSKNAQSLIRLSQARAAAILAASMHDLQIYEYSPREVKKSVTGNGNASKEQVQFSVME
jgi:crossover junction endodeoxyribonuclease RuvC